MERMGDDQMTKPFGMSATVQHRRQFEYPEAPEDDPVTQILLRGRKSSAQWGHELSAAERIAGKTGGTVGK